MKKDVLVTNKIKVDERVSISPKDDITIRLKFDVKLICDELKQITYIYSTKEIKTIK